MAERVEGFVEHIRICQISIRALHVHLNKFLLDRLHLRVEGVGLSEQKLPRRVGVEACVELSDLRAQFAYFVHGLVQFGVGNVLTDPQLALFRDTTLVAANDNWYDAPNALAIAGFRFGPTPPGGRPI